MQVDTLLRQGLDFITGSPDDLARVSAVSEALHAGLPVAPVSIALACAILRRALLTPCPSLESEHRRLALMQAARDICASWIPDEDSGIRH